jgi:hypothetical protein
MTRLCERPGCSEPGAAAYGMHPEDLMFWLAPLDRWNEVAGGVLCKRHADAMVVPRGWTLDDRREPIPRLFRPPAGPAGGAARAPSPRRRAPAPAAAPAAEQLELGHEPPSNGETPASDEAELASDAPWMPSFDTDDDLDGLLEVRSPLLARAFRGEDRPPRQRPT